MNPSLIRRLEDLQSRFEELGMELSDPEVIRAYLGDDDA